MTTIGFIGAGNMGSQVARRSIEAGYDVVLSNSRDPQTLSSLVAELGPRARAATPEDAATAADIAVISIPFSSYKTVPVEPLAGKVVIDTNNYYWERDGRYPAIDRNETTDLILMQEYLPASKVVRAFSHLRAAEITTDGLPSQTPDRRALAIAGDDPNAKAVVARIYDEFGFDAVDAGAAADSWRIGRGQAAQVTRQNAEQLRTNLENARQ